MDFMKGWLKYNLSRYWLFIVIAIFLPLFDKSILSVYLMLATISVIILATEIMRKELFPYIKLNKLISQADDSPLASAIVCAAVIYLISVIIQACVIAQK